MNENAEKFESTVQVPALLMENRHPILKLNRHDFVWITRDQGCETALPFQVQSSWEDQQSEWVETDRGLIRISQIQASQPSEQWLSLLANQWLINAVLTQRNQVDHPSQILMIARELRILTGYQLSIIRWYLLQHREVQAVWFENRENQLLLGIEFCFLKKSK